MLNTRYRRLPILLVATLLTFPTIGQEILTLDSENSLMLREVGAVATFEEGELRILTLLPGHGGADSPKVDLERGDVVKMMNGVRIRDLATARETYEAVEAGEEVKLAVARDDRRFLVAFDRQAPGEEGHGSDVVVRRMAVAGGGDAGDLQPILGLAIIASEKDGAVTVARVLPIGETPLEDGDVVRRAAGQEIASAGGLAELVEGLEVGATIELVVERGGEEKTLEAVKQEMRGAVQIRRSPS